MQSRIGIDCPSWLAWFVIAVQIHGLMARFGVANSTGVGIERIPLG